MDAQDVDRIDSARQRAVDVGKQFDAEIAVTGKVTANENKGANLYGMINYRAMLNTKVIKTTTGDVLFSVSKQAGNMDITPDMAAVKAISKTAEAAGREFVTSIATKLFESAMVKVSVSGLASINQLDEFKEIVRYFDGVSDARSRSFTKDTADLELTLKYGNAQTIAAKIEGMKGWNAKILEMGGHEIKVSVSKGGSGK